MSASQIPSSLSMRNFVVSVVCHSRLQKKCLLLLYTIVYYVRLLYYYCSTVCCSCIITAVVYCSLYYVGYYIITVGYISWLKGFGAPKDSAG